MSTKMSDDKLNALKDIATPAPTDAARRRALDAAMLAFDEAQKKSSPAPQGGDWPVRLRSIFHAFRGNWIMDTRISIGLGTAAIASSLSEEISGMIEIPITRPAQSEFWKLRPGMSRWR